MDRTSIVAALTLVAGACFYDHAPTTGGPTTQDTSTGTTAAAPTTGVATTSDDTTGTTGASGSASEGASTTGDPTTTAASDPTTTAMDPSTTQPMNATTTGAPSTGGTRGDCSGKALLACYKCCADAEPGSQVFLGSLAACACSEKHPCAAACIDSLCKGLYPEDTCLACLGTMGDMTCLNQANTACQSTAECSGFLECVADSNCANNL
jgi:hypothetical protein